MGRGWGSEGVGKGGGYIDRHLNTYFSFFLLFPTTRTKRRRKRGRKGEEGTTKRTKRKCQQKSKGQTEGKMKEAILFLYNGFGWVPSFFFFFLFLGGRFRLASPVSVPPPLLMLLFLFLYNNNNSIQQPNERTNGLIPRGKMKNGRGLMHGCIMYMYVWACNCCT